MNNTQVRLHKYLARCGIASRRHSEKLISEGRVSVNGKITTKLGTTIEPGKDEVCFDGKIVQFTSSDITIVLNKPAGYVSTMSDPQGRPCVANLIPVDEYPSIFPVGRLDRLTRGLLVFTTDGDLGQKLLHPKNIVNKTYSVIIDGYLEKNSKAYNKLIEGVEILSGKTSPCELKIIKHFDFAEYLNYENEFFLNSASAKDVDALPSEKELLNKKFTHAEITIHEGKNRQVRRMFAAVGYQVLLLERISIGNFKLTNLEVGKYRKLSNNELSLMEN